MEEPTTEAAEAQERSAPARAAHLAPCWTPEEAIEKARLGGRNGRGKPKKLSLTGAIERELRKLDPNAQGERNYRLVAKALVTACKNGDVQAIKLLIDRVDGAIPQASKTTVSESRSIVVRQREGDPVQLERTITTTQESAQDAIEPDAQLP